jgi:hypothetical protein
MCRNGVARLTIAPCFQARLQEGDYAVGGGTDLVARLMGQWPSERLGQPFIIENRTGAAT